MTNGLRTEIFTNALNVISSQLFVDDNEIPRPANMGHADY